MDKLHPPIVEWSKIWYVRILDTTCSPCPRFGLFRLLPHQLPWSSGHNKERMEVPSCCFCGMGLYNIATKITAATINYFLQHYNTSTSIGLTLQACLKNLQLELGVPDNPLRYDFSIWGALVADSWIKSLWEKIHAYEIDIKMD